MTKEHINTILGDFEHWRLMSNRERMGFARAMRGLQYDRDALEIACAFWVHGYRMGTNEQS